MKTQIILFSILLQMGITVVYPLGRTPSSHIKLTGRIVMGPWYMDIPTRKGHHVRPDSGFDEDGKLSPDGKRIVFDFLLGTTGNEKRHELRIIDIDGKNERTLMQDELGFYFDWSPDSKFIVARGIEQFYQYFIIDLVSREYWQIDVPKSKVKGAHQPYWSNDGNSILFISGFNQPTTKVGLFRIRLDGKEFETVSVLPHMSMGELSPDQKAIVFIPDRIDDKSVYIFSIEAANTRQAAKTRKGPIFPFWSPDNQWIGCKLITNTSKDDEFAVWHVETGERRSFPLRYESTFQWWGPQSGTPPDCEKIIKEMLGPGEKLEALSVDSTSQK